MSVVAHGTACARALLAQAPRHRGQCSESHSCDAMARRTTRLAALAVALLALVALAAASEAKAAKKKLHEVTHKARALLRHV